MWYWLPWWGWCGCGSLAWKIILTHSVGHTGECHVSFPIEKEGRGEGSWMHLGKLGHSCSCSPPPPPSSQPQLRGSQFSPEQEERGREGGCFGIRPALLSLSTASLSLSTLPTRHLIIGGSRAGGQGWAGAAPAKLTDKLIGTYMHSHTRAGETEGRTEGGRAGRATTLDLFRKIGNLARQIRCGRTPFFVFCFPPSTFLLGCFLRRSALRR